jgi:DNA-binding response OmpR family regulator
MAKYFALLPFNQDKISWLLEKLAIHYKTLVTIDPIIYEYYADLLIKFGTEEEYVKYANEVGQIDDYNNREEYLMIRRSIRLQSLKDYQTEIKENLKTEEMRREWVQRFNALELIAETLKKKVLIIDNAPSSTDVIRKCLEFEQFEVVVLKQEDMTSEYVKQLKADLILINVNPTSPDGEKTIQCLLDLNPYNLLMIDSYQQKKHIDEIETLPVPINMEYLLLAARRTILFAKRHIWTYNKERKTVIVVDDKETIAKVLSIYLMSDYNVIWLADGLEAVKWVMSKGAPDLMIVDIRMPGMRGDDFLEWIKQNKQFKHIPIVMLSSEDSTVERIRLCEIGAEDYIVKPFNPMELKIRIKKIIPV